MNDKTLRERCHVNTNEDGDCFVGVKADSDDAVVYFPLGYSLPDNEVDLRRDIKHLFEILAAFSQKEDRVLHVRKFEAPQSVDFPIQAYLDVINYYLSKGKYYYETEPMYKTDTRGRTDWSRTIKNQTPQMQNGSPVYLKRTVRTSQPNENNIITEINKYCVYESFSRLGWLFVSTMPEKPTIGFDKRMFLAKLRAKMGQTNNDADKKLFRAMIAMTEFIDDSTIDKQFYFGTEHFERVWERLIDITFGIPDKENYFPRTNWRERTGKAKSIPKHALEPDTIMILPSATGVKYYVLDAKYYRYGWTANPEHLPESSSINKQITYGEYVRNRKANPGDGVYNAFLMPFNLHDNAFGITSWSGNVAEATGEWRMNSEDYERIQGIVIDVKFLMTHYQGDHTKYRAILARAIEFGIDNPF